MPLESKDNTRVDGVSIIVGMQWSHLFGKYIIELKFKMDEMEVTSSYPYRISTSIKKVLRTKRMQFTPSVIGETSATHIR